VNRGTGGWTQFGSDVSHRADRRGSLSPGDTGSGCERRPASASAMTC